MTASVGLPEADWGSIKGLLRDLRGKNYRRGVVAVAAVPSWPAADELTLDGQQVRIAVGPSVLAIRDAMRLRAGADWVVILTDQPMAEIPIGVAEHLVTNRLRNLDPFPLLRNAFAAAAQEFGLLGDENAIARAMLREVGDKPTPAPGGVLTNDHVFTELARTRFGLAPVDFTPHHVAVWSADPVATERYSAWSATADPVLVEQFLRWLSRRLGELGPVLVDTWQQQGPAQIVPLGLIAGLVAAPGIAADDSADAVTRVRTRLEMEIGNPILAESRLAAWGAVASLAVAACADPSSALTSAQAWVPKLQAGPLVPRSDVLPTALALRITGFAKELAQVAKPAAEGGAVDVAAVENAWAAVCAHRDSQVDTADAPRDVRVGAATLRLLRRLAAPWPQPATPTEWLAVYRRDLSWVDGVVNNAYIGAGDPQLADATHRLVDAIRTRRARLDREFAAVLAAAGTERHTGSAAALYLEDVLDRVVAPLTARRSGGTGLGSTPPDRSPVLLIVADGMDVATSNDVVADAGRRRPHWQDCVPAEQGPLTALAVLPTVTTFSRCALLTGALASGGQDRERAGFADWLQQQGLRGQGQVLFHKGDLDAVSKGHSLAFEVRQAVQDTARRPVVACVLNDIDDALDRSDPIGTTWSIGSFKHLDALLSEAAAVGRTVVLLSDHGHVVERREQPSVQRGDQISARYRSAASVAGADEVLVHGERVRTDDHTAVLAVDEQLRYTGLKAGYHGGAALAEVCVAVSILVYGAIPTHLGLEPSPGGAPSWWNLDAAASAVDRPSVLEDDRTARSRPAQAPKPKPVPPEKTAKAKAAAQDSLFDFGDSAARTEARSAPPEAQVLDEVGRLLAGDLFAGQFKVYGRTLQRVDIGELLRTAIAGNGLVPLTTVADIFEVKPTKARSLLAWVSQILNIDGVVVIAQQGDEVAVATALLFEQFGVSR